MKKYTLLVFVSILFLKGLYIGKLSAQESKISATAIDSTLTYLASDELMGRETGSEGIEKAAIYIEAIFKKHNIQPYFRTYRDSFEVKNLTGYNLVGYIEGTDEVLKNEFVVIGAHYDHVGIKVAVANDSIANGANDNAAGTVGVLELAKYFGKNTKNKRSILFALFSGEEMGLQGSKHLAKKLKANNFNLYAMLNLEMIGVPMKAKDYKAYLTGYKSSNFAEKFNEYSGEKVLGFLPQANQLNLFKRSDNYPFYLEFNVPAQTLSTFDFTNYRYYHHIDDEASEMDFNHMAELIESLLPGIQHLANTEEKELKLLE